MQSYTSARRESFKNHPLHNLLKEIIHQLEELPVIRDYPEIKVKGSLGQGNWATVPWIALLDSRITTSTQNGVYIVFLFAADMSRVYLTLHQGVANIYAQFGTKEAKEVLRSKAVALRQRPDVRRLPGFRLDWDIDLAADSGVGAKYVDSTIAYKAYERTALPADKSLAEDIAALLQVYRAYADEEGTTASNTTAVFHVDPVERTGESGLKRLIDQAYQRITARGFSYPRAEFSAFCVSLKSKPFVLLTGISGTGKTRLVELLARQFGVSEYTIAVRPDWSDSTDLLGYRDLQGNFRPGPLLEILREANAHPDKPYFICLDEMNLARVEHYFAEFLSVIEKRDRLEGKIVTPPVLGGLVRDSSWSEVYISDNVFIIGTVNMDETTHPFSRKVLDRANVFEFNHVDLTYRVYPQKEFDGVLDWTPLRPAYCRLAEFYNQDPPFFNQVIAVLQELNAILEPGYFHIGYRVRDEVCLFLWHAREAGLVDDLSLDLQIQSKILPRVQGSSSTTRQVLVKLWNWVTGLAVAEDDPDLLGRTAEPPEDVRYPKTARKISVMLRRLEEDGYTSYWV